jgi:hypothetical protein
MYFSIQAVKQVVSPLDKEEPGFGTHFSKQCSLTFCQIVNEDMKVCRILSTSINCRALFIAASCRI